MNIFAALTEGRGRLSETNLSAFLAFLLAPHQAHGLSNAFLHSFLRAVAIATGDEQRFAKWIAQKGSDVEVDLEVRYAPDNRARTVDIQIKLFEEVADEDPREIHRIFIENKIRLGAAQEQQLYEEFEFVLADIDEGTRITAVFLTPATAGTNLSSEFDQLKLGENGQHRKAWVRWSGKSADVAVPSVKDLIQEMLMNEAKAEIEPVSEYTRHTLKAFVKFIDGLLPAGSLRARDDVEETDIREEASVLIGRQSYRLVRYLNNAIKIFDDTGEQHVAKPLLRQLNEERSLGINLYFPRGRKKNTRTLGREVLQKLRT